MSFYSSSSGGVVIWLTVCGPLTSFRRNQQGVFQYCQTVCPSCLQILALWPNVSRIWIQICPKPTNERCCHILMSSRCAVTGETVITSNWLFWHPCYIFNVPMSCSLQSYIINFFSLFVLRFSWGKSPQEHIQELCFFYQFWRMMFSRDREICFHVNKKLHPSEETERNGIFVGQTRRNNWSFSCCKNRTAHIFIFRILLPNLPRCRAGIIKPTKRREFGFPISRATSKGGSLLYEGTICHFISLQNRFVKVKPTQFSTCQSINT